MDLLLLTLLQLHGLFSYNDLCSRYPLLLHLHLNRPGQSALQLHIDRCIPGLFLRGNRAGTRCSTAYFYDLLITRYPRIHRIACSQTGHLYLLRLLLRL